MIPTQPELRAYSTDHLTDGARHWENTADNWEAVYVRVRNGLHSIGWEGDAADAAMVASHTDLSKVLGHVDHLRATAKLATQAADELRSAQRDILNTVADINDQGFDVGADWTVTDHRQSDIRSYSAVTRQVQAQTYATELGTKVAAFMTQEVGTAAQLSTAAATLATVQTNFPPKPKPHNDIQMMDSRHGFKLDPSTPTTTTTSPAPNMAPVDIATLLKRVSDWDAEEKDFAYQNWLHNQQPRDYAENDPRLGPYKAEERRLHEWEDRLADERRKIINDLTQIGAQTIDGQVKFPDGETVQAPEWRPYIPPPTHVPTRSPVPVPETPPTVPSPPYAVPPSTRLAPPVYPNYPTYEPPKARPR